MGSGAVAGKQAIHVQIQPFQGPLINHFSQIALQRAPLPNDATLVQGVLEVTDQDRGIGTAVLKVMDGGQHQNFAIHVSSLKGRLSRHSDKGQPRRSVP